MPSMIKEVEESSPGSNEAEVKIQQKSPTADWSMTLDEKTERAVLALGVQLQPFLGGTLEEQEELDAILSHCFVSHPSPTKYLQH